MYTVFYDGKVILLKFCVITFTSMPTKIRTVYNEDMQLNEGLTKIVEILFDFVKNKLKHVTDIF